MRADRVACLGDERSVSSKVTLDPVTQNTRAVVERFNEAFNRHDVDAIMQCMTADCVFENTRPAPDGTRRSGGRPQLLGGVLRPIAARPFRH